MRSVTYEHTCKPIVGFLKISLARKVMQIFGRDPNNQPNLTFVSRSDTLRSAKLKLSIGKSSSSSRNLYCLTLIFASVPSHKGGENVHRKIFLMRFTAFSRHAPLLPWTALFARPQEWAAALRYWFGAPFFHCCPSPALAEPSAHLKRR